MHLWPSLRIRDSFKRVYLEKLELSIHRMKRSSNGSPAADPLLSGDSSAGKPAGVLTFCHDLLMLFTCCWCCFCCGACDEEGN